ncbi:MAG TPA: GNAT family N-acetyltransferase [Saprospiraceae bacterium]|nr:GNAT family N-acetyltransferase [Saprospiraceae bacterium]HPI04920.1 GNAT family N-acetyltransferase [Saprospiraceae bacterium]
MLYRQFCQSAPADFPLFMQDWYLDAVCAGDGAWDAVVLEKAGQVVAVWPYFLKKKGWWRYVAMPPLARLMGPYVLPEWRNLRKEPALMEELIGLLPPELAAFEQDFPYTVSNWLPFYWKGFAQTTRYSYILKVGDLEKVWKNMAADYRNQKIPKAQQQVEIKTDCPLSEFIRVHNSGFERKGMRPPVATELLNRLDAALAEHRQREIFMAVDRHTGAIHSVGYLIWDARSAYLLMAGDVPELRASGAGILLIREMIRYTNEVLQLPVFDFLGSMIQPVERVRRQFGAVQQPYFRLRKEWSAVFRLGKKLLR